MATRAETGQRGIDFDIWKSATGPEILVYTEYTTHVTSLSFLLSHIYLTGGHMEQRPVLVPVQLPKKPQSLDTFKV
jgi:hypothetical protein